MMLRFLAARQGGRERIHALDLIRGVLILGMIADHIMYDCTTYLGVLRGYMTHPVRLAFHFFGAYLFVLLSGASASISRSNLKRGFIMLGIALGITLVTYILDHDAFIVFGIIHCLALCAIIYALVRPALDRIPHSLAPILWIALAGVTKYFTDTVIVDSRWLWMFGFQYKGFVSLDYYPIIPWIFVYFLGAWCGPYIFGRKLPEWFYNMRCEFLETVGRWSLWIYVLHQPVVLFIVLVIKEMYFRG